MPTAIIDIPEDKIAGFCRKWKIVEFSLFGSVLSDDFAQDSDVDVLVSFQPDAPWSVPWKSSARPPGGFPIP